MTIDGYINDFIRVFEGKPWYGKSVLAVLEKLEVNDLSKKVGSGHNVAQIIEHMITWRTWGIQMYSGNYEYRVPIDSEQDWAKAKSYAQADLDDLLTRLRGSQTKIISLLESKEQSWLSEMIPERKFSFEDITRGIIEHDIYHLGQIALLTKE